MEISFEEFSKLDMRVGEVAEAERIAGSRNLICMVVDFGVEKRQSVAALLQWYKPEELVGRRFAFVFESAGEKVHGRRISMHDFGGRGRRWKRCSVGAR